MSKSDDRLPLYQRLRDDIAQRINRREWLPGDLIPSESELAASFAVAIGTVRKAIDQLVADGVLERRQGKGTFVRRARFNSSLFRFFRFQSPVGERRVPESRILRREVLPAPSAVASALRIAEGAPVIFLSRLRLVDGEPLLAEEIWLEKAPFAAILDIETDRFGDLLYPLYEERCGRIVTSAEETLTVELADPLRARLLGREAGAPLVVVERIAFDLERRPLEWRRDRKSTRLNSSHTDISRMPSSA